MRAEARERLRRLIREIETRPPRRPRHLSHSPTPPGFETLLPGARRRETEAGPCTYMEAIHPLDGCVGEQPLREMRHATGDALSVLAPDAGAAGARVEDLLFLDIETTGLGGAGAMAFLVATGRVEGDALVVRQYLAQSPAEEGALLDALLADVRLRDGDPVLVTYNGRAFDAPILDGRATMHRRRGGFESARHVDALGPARTVYRQRGRSCRLAVIEAEVLGFARPGDDVPGASVPAWYFNYLRTGDARCIEPVAVHNELDVVVLAALLGRLCALVAGAREPSDGESLGLGRLYAKQRDGERAAMHFSAALRSRPPGTVRDEALARLGALHKSAGRRDEAEPLWRELARRPGAVALRAHEELAKYYEHHTHELERAAETVERALAVLEATVGRHDRTQASRWREGLRHRLARIHSKAARAAAAGVGGEAG